MMVLSDMLRKDIDMIDLFGIRSRRLLAGYQKRVIELTDELNRYKTLYQLEQRARRLDNDKLTVGKSNIYLDFPNSRKGV